jgi:hypothetical protein
MGHTRRGFVSRGLLIAFALLIAGASRLPAQVAKGRTLTGHGTFDVGDDGRTGQWRAEFIVDASGQLRGNFRLDGRGGGAPGVATGTADDRRLSFTVTVDTGESSATYRFEGAVLGTGVEGTFTGPRGSGTWQGFCDDVADVNGSRKPAADEAGPVVISN